MASILRQVLTCGILVVAASTSPDSGGKLATLTPLDLSEALRRKLAAAIDLLMEHGQLPHVGTIPSQAADSPSSSGMEEEKEILSEIQQPLPH